MSLRASLLLLLLVAAVPARAQRPARLTPARLTLLADTVAVGQRVRLAVAVDHAPGRSAVFPAVPPGDAEAGPLLAFGDAEAFAVRRLPPRVRGAVRTDSAVYDVAVFAVDTARVGPVTVRLVAGRDTVAVRTGVVLVPVRSELAGEDEPAPVGPADPLPGLLPVWLALATALALVFGTAVWAYVRWRRRPGPAAPRAEPYPEALATLDALAGQAPERAAGRTLSAREALRVYLGRRLGVPALESTTDELDAALAGDPRVTHEARTAAHRVLALADLVAFAGHVPPPAAADEAVADARDALARVERQIVEAETRAAASPQPARP